MVRSPYLTFGRSESHHDLETDLANERLGSIGSSKER